MLLVVSQLIPTGRCRLGDLRDSGHLQTASGCRSPRTRHTELLLGLLAFSVSLSPFHLICDLPKWLLSLGLSKFS